ncbi:type II 3-dehydroquinate dehydratase [Methyloradius palustris]|uniref:3-dehydroquinate dehydratase n=1 Tax=Methyloradius palustris TaxID=2778876 RepID=A0A8D5JV42_9PROT|nr:type II 3-dehydroquinate dehydratase [Methyloradius palustris]BCM23774.1 3-dehydroquinate dehydratase [Methyloradius palustris]
MVAKSTKSVLVLHGPNLNLLGLREPEHYGKNTLADIDKLLADKAKSAGIALKSFQSNAEAELIDQVQALATEPVDFLIINPAAFTHTSVALRDALAAVRIPFIEIHLSNVYSREAFRHHSYFTDIAVGVISGLGTQGYLSALDYAISQLNSPSIQ